MRKPLEALLGLLRTLHEAQRSVEAEMESCLKDFYKLARGKPLTARPERDDDKRVRAIYLAARLRSGRRVGNRRVRFLRRIKGRVNPGLIYKIARDYKNYEHWHTLDVRRRRLNARASTLNYALRDIRSALANKFKGRISDADYRRAMQLVPPPSGLDQRDLKATVGAVAYDRHLQSIEADIGALVLDWKRTFHLPFEPVLRWREKGTIRMNWGFVDRFYDAKGSFQVRSIAISEGVTKRWLRANRGAFGGGDKRITKILKYAQGFRKLLRDYSKLLHWAARWKLRAHAALHGRSYRSPRKAVG